MTWKIFFIFIVIFSNTNNDYIYNKFLFYLMFFFKDFVVLADLYGRKGFFTQKKTARALVIRKRERHAERERKKETERKRMK